MTATSSARATVLLMTLALAAPGPARCADPATLQHSMGRGRSPLHRSHAMAQAAFHNRLSCWTVRNMGVRAAGRTGGTPAASFRRHGSGVSAAGSQSFRDASNTK